MRVVQGPMRCRVPILLLFAVLAIPACRGLKPYGTPPPESPGLRSASEVPSDQQVNETSPERPTHGERGRALGRQMDLIVHQIIEATRPVARQIRSELEAAVAQLQSPEMLATNEAALRDWRSHERERFAEDVDALYDSALGRLEVMAEAAMATARVQARRLAGAPSLLDDGATGNPIVDVRITALEEVIAGATSFNNLEAVREHDKVRETELLQVFTSYGDAEAEAALNGRLLFFIGGNETQDVPRCVIVYRHDGGQDVSGFSFAQVVRQRVLRGEMLVWEREWAPSPGGRVAGFPSTETFGKYLISRAVEPVINQDTSQFEQLRDMRVQVDTQTSVLDASGTVMGCLDWRIEFNISRRGKLTWEVAGEVWDPHCTAIKDVLGR